MNRGDLNAIIGEFVTAAGYARCLLLVDPDVERLSAVADAICGEHGWPRLVIGRELSAALRDEPPQRRGRTAQIWVKDRLRAEGAGPVVCTEIDLLFEPRLADGDPFGLDPLGLFVQASRQTGVIVAWPGTFADEVLEYAVPEHAHYRTWSRPEARVVLIGAEPWM